MEVLIYVGSFVAFIAIYETIRRRLTGPRGERPAVQWAWLSAVVGCALAAILIGALLEL